MTIRTPWALLLPLLVAGCTSFTQNIPVAAIPEQPETARRFQVWTSGESYELHAVQLTPDTLAGVRYWHSPTCDSCRVAIPRTEIDSVRTLAFDGAETGIVVILAAPAVLLGLIWVLVITNGGRLFG